MAYIHVTTGVGSLRVGSYTDDELVKVLDAFSAAVANGSRGIWCDLAARGDEGAGVAWVPVAVPVSFVFDAVDLPVDSGSLPVVALDE